MDQASANMDLVPRPSFGLPHNVYGTLLTGIRLRRVFWFILVREFIRKHRVSPITFKLKLMTVKDEFAIHDITGVLAKPQAGDPPHLWRMVELFSETNQVSQETLSRPEAQLRLKEPQEAFTRVNQIKQKTCCHDHHGLSG